MLLELHIRNFAIIEEAHLEFGAGLNVLSGETGAGKTIILSALGLLLGSRASPDMIRAGEKEAVVEGLFELEGEVAIPELAERKSDGARRQLVVRRVIAEGGGRSRVTIDGELATVQSLGKIGASLVQVYGQHEQHSLLRAESHREILDRYANLDEELAAYRERYARAEEIRVPPSRTEPARTRTRGSTRAREIPCRSNSSAPPSSPAKTKISRASEPCSPTPASSPPPRSKPSRRSTAPTALRPTRSRAPRRA